MGGAVEFIEKGPSIGLGSALNLLCDFRPVTPIWKGLVAAKGQPWGPVPFLHPVLWVLERDPAYARQTDSRRATLQPYRLLCP